MLRLYFIWLLFPLLSYGQEAIVGDDLHYPLNISREASVQFETLPERKRQDLILGPRHLLKIKEKSRNAQGTLRYVVILEQLNQQGEIEALGEYLMWGQNLHNWVHPDARVDEQSARTALSVRLAQLGLREIEEAPKPPQGERGEGCEPTSIPSAQTNENNESSSRRPVQELSASPSLIEVLTDLEGMRSEVYDCSAGCATIGVGHKISEASESSERGQKDIQNFWRNLGRTSPQNERLTRDEAMTLLRQDLGTFERALKENLGNTTELTQKEYDALLMWTFNLGSGHLRKGAGTGIRRALDNKNWEQASRELLRWSKVNGQTAAGLCKRRLLEAMIFRGTDWGQVNETLRRLDQIVSNRTKQKDFLRFWEESMVDQGSSFSFERMISYIREQTP